MTKALKRRSPWVRLWIVLFFLIALVVFIALQNEWLVTTEYTLEWRVDGISQATEQVARRQKKFGLQTADANTSATGAPGEFVLVQLSDLHGKRFGQAQRRLLSKVAKQKPDMILITGDLVDSKRPDTVPAIELVRGLKAIAPVYIVFGNHEAWALNQQELLDFDVALESAGANVLRNEAQRWESKSGRTVLVVGLEDPELAPWATTLELAKQQLEKADGEEKAPLKLLVSHRPERFLDYVTLKADVVFTGHAHGGQWRLPWIGGIVAPDQGWFPMYDGGLYGKEKTAMVVHRGLGNSMIPLRLFNYPEVVKVIIRH